MNSHYSKNDSNSLRVQLDSGENKRGKYYVALYRKTDSFPSEKKAFRQVVQSVSKSEILFENLPADSYALAVYLDENNNAKMDKNVFGVPLEKYGFSNNVRKKFSAPSFGEARIMLDKDKTIKIRLE